MSREPEEETRQRRGPGRAEEGDSPELEPNEELSRAIAEAAASVEAHEASRRPGDDEGSAETAVGTDVVETQRELDAARERLLRLAADFDNFRRRALREREESYHFGHQNLVKDLLPSVDNLERAIEHAGQSGSGSGDLAALLQGVELVLREIRAVLAKHGVTEIEAEGQPFDPAVHEAMAQVEHPTAPANTVVQVFQRGYRLRDRLLRPARVVVSRGAAGAEPGSTSGPEG